MSSPSADASPEITFIQRLAAIFTAAFWREFWRRPCGARETLVIAGPMIVSTGSIALMNFADRVFLTWFDPRGMCAAFQAGCLLWAFFTFPTAIATFTNTFVAQYFGAGRKKEIGRVVWQGFFFSIVAGLLFPISTPLVKLLFETIGHSPDLVSMECDYWYFFSLGAVASIGHEPFASFFLGRREMKTVMYIAISAVLVNVVLDYYLIFGIGGHIRMGVKGAAIASAAALWFKLILYLIVIFIRDKNDEFGIRSSIRLQFHEMARLLKYGSMSAIQVTVENSFFLVFVLLMGWISEEAGTASGIAFNLNSLTFLPIFGIGVAIQTLVGNQVGARRPDLAARAVQTACVMGAAFSGVFALAFFFAPDFFVDIYARNSAEAFEAIRPLAIGVTKVVALYLFVDTMNTTFTAALRGAGDARFIMISTSCVALPVLAVIFIGVFRFHQGVYWCWGLLTSYLCFNSLLFVIRFLRGGWRDKCLVEGAPKEVDLVEGLK